MFNNVALDVVIGLVFIFLLYSLLMTIIQEIVARWFNIRANVLFRAMERMLKDEQPVKGNKITAFIYERAQDLRRIFIGKKMTGMVKKFYTHPTVKYLSENNVSSKPSYLQPQTFSQTMSQLLRGDDAANGVVRYDGSEANEAELIKNSLDHNLLNLEPDTIFQLRTLFADARQDVFVFRAKMEHWFNETMQRANGWYKKQTQTLLVILGLALAAAFNVDAIAIARILINDKDAREQMVQLATASVQKYGNIMRQIDSAKAGSDTLPLKIEITIKKDSSVKTNDTVINRIQLQMAQPYDSLLLQQYRGLMEDARKVQNVMGLGWGCSKSDSIDATCRSIAAQIDEKINNTKDSTEKAMWQKIKTGCVNDCSVCQENPYQGPLYEMLVGWMITALAISLGAPFWFDLLNKVIKLRETGSRPDNSGGATTTATLPAATPGGQIIRG